MDENKLLEYSCLLQEYFVNLGMVEWLAVALNTLINCLLVIVAVTFLDIIVLWQLYGIYCLSYLLSTRCYYHCC